MSTLMSQQLINRSKDLRQLRDDGYHAEVSNGYLIIDHIPYLTKAGAIMYGTLVSQLDLNADITIRPNTHVVKWSGTIPCKPDGTELDLVSQAMHETIREGLVTNYEFSQKPVNGYNDFHHKMTTYIKIIEQQARAKEPTVKARVNLPTNETCKEYIFCYTDTASSRAGIIAINNKLKKHKVAIIGLGGTGSYVLDLLAKTQVQEIHLFDNDKFLQHNAFRSPGAAAIDDLMQETTKVKWFNNIYSNMRKGIISHEVLIDYSNLNELDSMSFIFICIDKNSLKKIIIEYLIEHKIPFIDTGVGASTINDDEIQGSTRITPSTLSDSKLQKLINSFDPDDNDYSTNIQIAELNMLSAVLAVIKWKKMCGFYNIHNSQHNTIYTTHGNVLTND